MTDCPDCTRYEATLEFISYLTNEALKEIKLSKQEGNLE